MLTREKFASLFGPKPLFGMVHLLPLPGAPLYGGSLQEVVDAAARDAEAIAAGGASGIVFENFGDRPFRKNRVEPETIAAMAAVIGTVTRGISLPFGVNVLRNDGLAALGIAAATGARFVRVNILVGAMLADQGIIESEAAELQRKRRALGGEVAVFGDHFVKHAVPLAPYDELQAIKDLRHRALADAVIVSGSETGAPVDRGRLEKVREAVDAPLLIGSGLQETNAGEMAKLADGAIVGTSIKRDGNVDAPVERERVSRLVAAFR